MELYTETLKATGFMGLYEMSDECVYVEGLEPKVKRRNLANYIIVGQMEGRGLHLEMRELFSKKINNGIVNCSLDEYLLLYMAIQGDDITSTSG